MDVRRGALAGRRPRSAGRHVALRPSFAARWSEPVVRCTPLALSLPAARFVLFVGRRPPLPKLPNGLPMCRRTGSIELPAGQVWAVGTMGLLDTLNAAGIANVAVPDVGRSLVEADAAVAQLVVTSPTTRLSPLVERYSLSVAVIAIRKGCV